jgi:RNA polymerase sigma factor (sigma-70 family)
VEHDRHSEHELTRLSDDQLLETIRQARADGRRELMAAALRILVFGYQGIVERRVALKVPPEHVQEVADRALESAFMSAFDGASQGEFRHWLHRITARRIADYHRARAAEPEIEPLAPYHVDRAGRGEGVVEVQDAVGRAYRELSPTHRAVVENYVFDDCSATTTARRACVTEANVHQIASRFRKRVRELLSDSESGR